MAKLTTSRGKPTQDGATIVEALETDFRLFLMHTTLNGAADYAARGRKFESLSNDQLTEHFVETFRKLADDPAKWEHRALKNDLVAEFQLRDIEPPCDLVSGEFKRVCDAVSKKLDAMQKEDPDHYAEVNRGLAWDFGRFLSERRGSN
jgi:hypothetical protein